MKLLVLSGAILMASAVARAAVTIDPANKSAWSGNLGWTVWRAGSEGVSVNDHVCSGFVWSANCGWIHLGNGSPLDGVRYSNASPGDYGVNLVNGGFAGAQPMIQLRGFAYGANIGWIHFEDQGNPRISLSTGRMSGWVWSANCGWICLDGGSWFVQTRIEKGPDLDGDGIADAHERETAPDGSLAALSETGDADGDGVTDRAEFIAGTHPLDPSSRLAIIGFEAGDEIRVTWTSSPFCEYRLSTSLSLGRTDWQTVVDHITPAGDTTTVCFPRDGVPSRFFRVEATRALEP